MNRMKANDAYIKRLSFGRAIRKFRERKNMSQEDLALSAQMDRSYVGRVERGEKSVSLDKIWQLCTALEATPAELFLQPWSLNSILSGWAAAYHAGASNNDKVFPFRRYLIEGVPVPARSHPYPPLHAGVLY